MSAALRLGATGLILGVLLNGSSPHVDLRLMAQQGNTTAQLRYADSLLRGGDRGAAIYWLQQASRYQEPTAALALSELIPAQQQLWLERAASWGSRAARQQLVVDATRRNDDTTVHRWLSSASDLSATEQAIAWQWELAQTSLQNLPSVLSRAPEHDTVSVLVKGLTWMLEPPANGHCKSLVIALPNGPERLQVLRLFSEFQHHPVGRLPWCPALTEQTDQTADVLFVRTQRAFNAAGVIHLPADASAALLAHELAHTAGLADEYSMRTELAEDFCAGNYDHPAANVVVTASKIMSGSELQSLWQRLPWRQYVERWQLLGEQLEDGRWRLGSSAQSSIGLFPANTCERASGYAWKPVAMTTAMEVYEVNQWPPLYLKLMGTELGR